MTVSSLNFSSAATPAQLVKLTSGEYTAASVVADPRDAARLWLVKQPDGNYVAATPATASATAQSSSNVLASLNSLTLGGQ